MKKRFFTLFALTVAALFGTMSSFSQNSAPAPGQPGGNGLGLSSAPAPGAPAPPPPGYNGPVGGPMWGSPWNSGWGGSVGYRPGWNNNGYVTVTACGYDAQGIWRVIPLYVNYNYNGVQYNVTVVNAYNPWTDSWDDNVDMPAYNTSYYINGNNYNFYTPLSTGTYYFNL